MSDSEKTTLNAGKTKPWADFFKPRLVLKKSLNIKLYRFPEFLTSP
jgi:hypothetical protein